MSDLSRLALNTATLGHNLEGAGQGWPIDRVIDACAARGIGGIVPWRREIGSYPGAVAAHARAAGVEIVGLCRSPYVVGPETGDTDAIFDAFQRSIDLAHDLGAGVLTIVIGGVEPGRLGVAESLLVARDRIARMCPVAEAARVRLALEPLHPVYAADRCCLVTVKDAVDICIAVDSLVLGIAIDAYHVWWDTTLAEQLVRLPPGRIFGLHLCDWLRGTTDTLLDRGMMGDGVIDLKALRRTVEGAGYAGPCEVEIFSAGNWWQRDPGEVLDVMIDRYRQTC